MVVIMAGMGNNLNLFGIVLRAFPSYAYKQYLIALLFLCVSSSNLLAMDWEVVPSVGADVSYTDNVYLSKDKQYDTIFRVSPAIRLTGKANRASLNLSYTLNATSYADNTSDDKLTNSLNSDANIIFLENILFLDLSADVRQRAVSNSAVVGADQLSITDDYSEVTTTQISPYIDTLLGKYIYLVMRYSYTNTSYQESLLDSAESETGAVSASISSASNGSRVNWAVNYSARDTRYGEDSDETKFERINGVLSISPSLNWEIISSVGYERNDYVTTNIAEDTEGETYGIGLQWRPSATTRLKVMGQNRYSGDSVTIELDHQRGRTEFAFSYMEDLTVDSSAKFEAVNLGSVSNGVFLQKRGSLRLSRRFIRSNLSLSIQSDEREHQNSDREERTIAANVGWSRKLSPRTDLNISLGWNQSDLAGSEREDESKSTNIGVSHRFGKRTTATLEYDNITRTSSEVSAEYERNLVTAGIRIIF